MEKPSRNEEEYFAKREAELLKERQSAAHKAEVDAERRSHYMKCPKCGNDLVTEEYHGVEIDRCMECNGMWFDAGEVDKLKDDGAAGAFLRSIFRGVSSS